MMPLAHIDGEQRGAVALARVSGEIDASNAGWAGGRLRAMLGNRSEALAIDLTDTIYLDSAGVALVLGLAAELGTHQQALSLVVAAGSPVARIVSLSGLDGAIATYATVEAALAGAQPPAPDR